MKLWMVFLAVSVVLGVLGAVAGHHSRQLFENARVLASSRCFTRSGVVEVASITIESNVHLRYVVKHGGLYLVIEGLYEEEVARFSGENVVVLNRDLWDVFFTYCVSTTASKIREEATRTATLALGLGVSSVAFAVMGLVELLRRKR